MNKLMDISKPVDLLLEEESVFLPVETVQLTAVKHNSIFLTAHGREKVCVESPMYNQPRSCASTFYCLKSASRPKQLMLRLDICRPDIFRLRMSPRPAELHKHSHMVVNSFAEPVKFTVKDRKNTITIETAKMRISIQKEPYQLCVYDKKGHEVFSASGPETNTFNQLDSLPLGLIYSRKGKWACASDSLQLRHDEHIYGLGEQFSKLDKRGQTVRCWTTDGLGNTSHRCYKPIPLFMSTRGYGLFFHTTYPSVYWLGSVSHVESTVVLAEKAMDYYFVLGPSLKRVLYNYTEITGRSPLPPKWSFGLTTSKDSYLSQKEIMAVARKFRKKKVPCDLILLGTAWMGWEDGRGFKLEFDKKAFPQPQSMITELARMGFRTTIFVLSFMADDSALYKEGLAKGVLIKTSVPSKPPMKTGIVDFSNPKAVLWFQERVKKLLKLGAGIIFTDFGETIPTNVDYHGYSGLEMHNLYPLLYTKAAFEAMKDVRGQGIIWARSAYAGSQRYPIHWSGDPACNFPTLASAIRGGLSLGLSGFSFWSHNMGGYLGTPSRELYTRWFQVGFLGSHPQPHGNTPREPWEFGPELLRNFRKYANLHYALMPYIYSEAYHCSKQGLPMHRALVLEFQDDPNTFTIDDQYMFGRRLLIAPILDESLQRRIYLPAGDWTDYWTKKRYRGPQWINYKAALARLPIFVRPGSIIPFGPTIQHVDEKPLDPLRLEIYPVDSRTSRYAMFDGQRTINYIVASNRRSTTISLAKGYSNYDLVICNHRCPKAVTLNSRRLPRQMTKSSLRHRRPGWYFDKKAQYITIKLSLGKDKGLLRLRNDLGT